MKTLRKYLLYGIIIFLLYWLIAAGGLHKVKTLFNSKKAEDSSQIEANNEAKNLKKAPWSHVDKKVPKEFDSGYMPEGGVKTTIKKLTNTIKDDYGYKK